MNTQQKAKATALAKEQILNGKDPEGVVHILYYPNSACWSDSEIMGLSTPLTREDWVGG